MNPRTEIVAYTPTKAALADLTSRYKGIVFDVTTAKGMSDAKAAKKELTTHRTTLEKARVSEKAEALAYGKFVDSEAKKIADELAALEDPITQQIEVETKREQREREAAILAEQERLAAEERAKKEAEERRLAEERAKLTAEREAFEQQQRDARAKLQAEEDANRKAMQDEANRIRDAHRAEEEKLAAERRAVEDAQRKQREEEEAQRRAKEERERQERLALEQRQREEREAREVVEREAKRKEQDRLDGRATLESFVERYGDVPEFGAVVAAIRAYFERQKRRAA